MNTATGLKKDRMYHFLFWLPVAGVVLFLILYYIATLFYPGGNYENVDARGFSWKHNFWCHLLSVKAINGSLNAARPWAIAAMIDLAVSVILFMILIPTRLDLPSKMIRMIQGCGVMGILISFLLLSAYHDEAINTGSAFAIIALGGIITGMFRSGKIILFLMGVISVFMSLINFIIYYSRFEIIYLPLIQKITFAFYLLWFVLSCIELRKAESYKL